MSRSPSGKLNGKAYADVESVLDLIKLIFTDDRERLLPGRNYSIQWENDLLTIKLSDSRIAQQGSKDANKDNNVTLIVRTEGRFLQGTTGEMSKDRKEVRFPPGQRNDIKLIITGLSGNR